MDTVTMDTLPTQVNKTIVQLVEEKKALRKKHKEESEEIHDKLWAAVHEQYPSLPEDENYSLDGEHSAIGIVILKKDDKKSSVGHALAKALFS